MEANVPSALVSPALAGAAVERPAPHGLLRFARIHVAATFCLLVAGAAVTSNDAGLAVVDWPSSLGFFNPLAIHLRGLMHGLVAFEHGHREIGMVVGLLTIVHCLWLRRAGGTPLLRRLGVVLLVLVCIQGGLGGLTVKLKLPPVVSILHGMVAQTFFCLSIATAWLLAREQSPAAGPAGAPTDEARRLVSRSRLAFAAIYLQLLLGAIVRHTVAKWRVPTFGDLPVVLHMTFALVVLLVVALLVATLAASTEADARVRRSGFLLGALVLAQLALGILSVATRTDPLVTVLHVITGAAILGTALVAVLRSARLAVRGAS